MGNPPVATILAPQDGSFFNGGDAIAYNGDGTDVEDGSLPNSAFTWTIDFLHESHVHPGTSVTGQRGGTFVIPTTGHDFSGLTRYRFSLTVTDSNGLTNTKFVIIWPNKVNLSFDTVPSGLTLYLDGIAYQTPFVHDTLVNFQHTIEARNVSQGLTTYTFQSWSDGGAQMHTITVPPTAQSYTATYATVTNITMGETNIAPSDDIGNANLLLAQQASLSQAATLQNLSFYVTTPAGNLRLGLYDSSGPGNGPGNKLAETNPFVPTAGWNTVNVISPSFCSRELIGLPTFPIKTHWDFASIARREF